MSTQDKPITTQAAMRAAEKILDDWRVVQFSLEPGEGVDDSASAEQLSAIIDQQTHLPELIEKIHAALGAMPDNSREADELRSVLEKVKGEK